MSLQYTDRLGSLFTLLALCSPTRLSSIRTCPTEILPNCYACLLPKVVYFSHVLSFPRKQASQLLRRGVSPRHLEDSASSAGTVHSISVVDSARFTPDQAVFWAMVSRWFICCLCRCCLFGNGILVWSYALSLSLLLLLLLWWLWRLLGWSSGMS